MISMITGASSVIGRDISRILSEQYGCDLIFVARRIDRLKELKAQLPTRVQAISCDLSSEQACRRLYQKVKGKRIDILINNAGFGLFGSFEETSLDRELEMIDTNIRAMHILSKLFLHDFVRRDSGYLLNVASSAAFYPGPLMATYYATKAYVLRLSQAVKEELRRRGSRVSVTALCPGPVRTEFDQVADVRFSVRGLPSRQVAQYAVESMFRQRLTAIPGPLMKAARLAQRAVPDWLVLRISYHMQKRKQG